MKALGRHFILECYACDEACLDNVETIETAMLEAANVAKATIIKSFFHPFVPQGVTGVVVLAESHISIHTWPELGYAAIDIFTCGTEAQPRLACDYLVKQLGAGRKDIQEFPRGILTHPGDSVPSTSYPATQNRLDNQQD